MKTIILWGIFAILLTLGFMEAHAISRFSAASLRFNEPVSGYAAYRARQHSAANADTFWPTFWNQGTALLDIGIRQSQTAAIYFSGDASLVWPLEFLAGTAPSSVDNSGIALSEPLAHRLWGSTDIIGMGVYVDGEPRTVRGIFNGTSDLVLISFHIEDTTQYFTAAELRAGYGMNSGGTTRSEAEGFALAAGLGRPDFILMGGAVSLARFMSVLPLLIPALYGLVLITKLLKKYYPMAAAPVFFAGLILFAVLLPFMLNQIPDWLIPTHWSDISFWGTLVSQASDSLREFLSVNPMLRDVELRVHLLRQALIMVLSVCCGILVCYKNVD